MTRYTLDKMSSPGWTFSSDHLFHILNMLKRDVCTSCKQTKAEFDVWVKDNWEEEFEEYLKDNMNPYSFSEFFPENFDALPFEEQIGLLMQTACGCEYDFRDSEDPESGKHFVEIDYVQ